MEMRVNKVTRKMVMEPLTTYLEMEITLMPKDSHRQL